MCIRGTLTDLTNVPKYLVGRGSWGATCAARTSGINEITVGCPGSMEIEQRDRLRRFKIQNFIMFKLVRTANENGAKVRIEWGVPIADSLDRWPFSSIRMMTVL